LPDQTSTHDHAQILDSAGADPRKVSLLERLRQRWWGVLLLVTAAVCILWLAMTDRLGLYIHPRYFVFTVIMALIAVALGIVSVLVHVDTEAVPKRRGRTVLQLASVVGSLAVVGSMVVLPPSTLSVATADQRSVNSGTLAGEVQGQDAQTVLTSNPDFSTFGIKDWATLLRQTTRPADLEGRAFTGVGFVIADPDAAGVFYVSRFVVNCCAVDAQPVGVPVELDGWSQELKAGDWVEVSGTLTAGDATHPLVVGTAKVDKVAEPADPYDY
jgi:putative membrane protein